MKKRLIAAILAGSMGLTLAGCASKADQNTEAETQPVSVEDFEPVTLKFSTMNSSEHFSTQSAYNIKETVESKTGGKITIDVYPGGQLGDYDTVTDEIMRGTIDMAFQSAVDKFDASAAAHALPYLCKDYEDLPVVYGKDGYLWQNFEKTYSNMGVKFLGAFTEGFQGVGSVKEITNPTAAGENKKYTLRCPSIKSITQFYSEMGFSVSTLPYSETLSGIQTGVVDGWVGGTPTVNYESFRDIISSYYFYKSYVESSHFIMNMDRFKSLPEEYQQIIQDAVWTECEESFTKAEEMDDQGLQDLENAGIQTITFSQDEIEEMADATRETVLEKSRATMGDEFIDGLEAFLKENGL